jgi:hypothetical protein
VNVIHVSSQVITVPYFIGVVSVNKVPLRCRFLLLTRILGVKNNRKKSGTEMVKSSRSKVGKPSELSLAITSLQWQQAIDCVTSNPQLARVWCLRMGFYEGRHDSNVLPLHEACTGVAPTAVARAIVEAYPDAVHQPESAYRRLPLHCACRKNANSEIVRLLLLQQGNDAGLVPDSLGRLPLHYALSNGAEVQIVTLLLDASPASAKGMDDRGWTPLHVACNVGAALEIIQRLVELNPEAAIMQTDKGSSPIGLVKRTCAHRDDIKLILCEARDKFDRGFVNPLKREARKLEDLMIV